eukprot:g32416.t1
MNRNRLLIFRVGSFHWIWVHHLLYIASEVVTVTRAARASSQLAGLTSAGTWRSLLNVPLHIRPRETCKTLATNRLVDL